MNIKFVKDELNNIKVLNKNGEELPGFIKHIELYKNGEEIIHLNITDEEYKLTNNIFVFVRHNNKANPSKMIFQLEEAFEGKNIIFENQIVDSHLIVVDLFFYE